MRDFKLEAKIREQLQDAIFENIAENGEILIKNEVQDIIEDILSPYDDLKKRSIIDIAKEWTIDVTFKDEE